MKRSTGFTEVCPATVVGVPDEDLEYKSTA